MTDITKNRQPKTRARPDGTLPTRFVPRFLEDVDGRNHAVKTIRNLKQSLIDESQADSTAKEILCEEAAWLWTWMQTLKCRALEEGTLDAGSYVQSTNCLSGLLRAIGLAKVAKKLPSAKEYFTQLERKGVVE